MSESKTRAIVEREVDDHRDQLSDDVRSDDQIGIWSSVDFSLPISVRLDDNVAKKLWNRLESEQGRTIVQCKTRDGQFDIFYQFNDLIEIDNVGNKKVLAVHFTKLGGYGNVSVTYDIIGGGRTAIRVFGRQPEADSLRRDLVSIVNRGRVSGRLWHQFQRTSPYIGPFLIILLLWMTVSSAIVIPTTEDVVSWTDDHVVLAQQAGYTIGILMMVLAFFVGKLIVSPMQWLMPMVSIELGGGVDEAEKKRWWRRSIVGVVVGTSVALIASILRSAL